MNDAHACSDTQENTVDGKNLHIGAILTLDALEAPRTALALRAEEPDGLDRDWLKAQNTELLAELEVRAVDAWAHEASAHRFSELYIAAVAETAALKSQLATIADERAAAQAKLDKYTEARAAKCLTGFESLVQIFQKEELEDERLIAVRALVARNESPVQTAFSVRNFLFDLQRDWGRELRKIPGAISSEYEPWLPTLDSQIAELKRYPEVLAKLDEADAQHWTWGYRGRNFFESELKELFRLGNFANEAIAASLMLLVGRLPADLEFETIKSGYLFLIHVRDLQEKLRPWDVENDLIRTVYAVQQKINELVDAGTLVTQLPQNAASATVNPEWSITVPAEKDQTDWSRNDDTRFTGSYPEAGADSGEHTFSNDYLAFNPANGQMMIGGAGGVDCYGNPFGSDFNDPGH